MTVFGSALANPGEDTYELARDLGRKLSAAGFRLCNGGYGGTMEAAARGAREALTTAPGTIGVTCDLFRDRTCNPWIDDVRRTGTLFERLEQLIALGDAYVVLPGGTGTLLELAAVLELTSKQFIQPRPIVFLGKYWRRVLDLTREPSGGGGRPPLRATVAESVEECITHLIHGLGGPPRES